MSIQTVRISEDNGRNNLTTLKRRTGVPTWNILRWAFCVSLAEATPPGKQRVTKNSPIEMTWHTFAGEYADVYMALLKERCHKDNLELTEKVLVEQLRLHIHRGIGYLVGDPNIKSIEGLISRAINN